LMRILAICYSLLMPAFIVVGGISLTLQPVAGMLYGAEDYNGLRIAVASAFKVMFRWLILMMLVIFLVLGKCAELFSVPLLTGGGKSHSHFLAASSVERLQLPHDGELPGYAPQAGDGGDCLVPGPGDPSDYVSDQPRVCCGDLIFLRRQRIRGLAVGARFCLENSRQSARALVSDSVAAGHFRLREFFHSGGHG